ncbi:MAG: glutamine synthetase [Haliea sp.]|nr:glutamine synthetase [Haliea sp.]MBK6740522.1 glutamine synthetase [Haliea sp.]
MTRNTNFIALLDQNPKIERVEAFVVDINGAPRGKWLHRDKALSLVTKGLPMPYSVYALDIWGADVEEAGLAFGTGDPDGVCWPIDATAALIPWAEKPTAQLMLSMKDASGEPYFADPRVILGGVVKRLELLGYTAVVATELEFYLTDRKLSAGDDVPPGAGQVLSIDALNEHQVVINAIMDACHMQNVPADTVLRENGPGQYEVNVVHCADACAAADHATLLKRIVKGCARQHGMEATFMAKPYGDQSGSGMHVHCSLLDQDGKPVFADDTGAPTKALFYGVGGLLATMPDMMLLFAPHANSYRRFRKNSHAPVSAGWGMDDRSAAVRVITGKPTETRIEQRVSGADCNPYLAVAGILAGVLHGITEKIEPCAALDPADCGTAGLPLPLEWGQAIDRFAASKTVEALFGASVRNMIVACKRQDYDGMLGRVSDVDYRTYFSAV